MGVVEVRAQRTPCEKALWAAYTPANLSTPPGIRGKVGVVESREQLIHCENGF